MNRECTKGGRASQFSLISEGTKEGKRSWVMRDLKDCRVEVGKDSEGQKSRSSGYYGSDKLSGSGLLKRNSE